MTLLVVALRCAAFATASRAACLLALCSNALASPCRMAQRITGSGSAGRHGSAERRRMTNREQHREQSREQTEQIQVDHRIE